MAVSRVPEDLVSTTPATLGASATAPSSEQLLPIGVHRLLVRRAVQLLGAFFLVIAAFAYPLTTAELNSSLNIVVQSQVKPVSEAKEEQRDPPPEPVPVASAAPAGAVTASEPAPGASAAPGGAVTASAPGTPSAAPVWSPPNAQTPPLGIVPAPPTTTRAIVPKAAPVKHPWMKWADLTEERATVSLCIPCAPEDIEPLTDFLLPSVRMQTHKPVEVVVALSSAPPSVAERAKANFLRVLPDVPIVVAAVAEKAYAGVNRNRAAKNSKGDLLVYADADDALHPRRLEFLARIFAHFRPKIILGGWSAGVEKVSPIPDPFQILYGKQILARGGTGWLGTLQHSVHQGQPAVDRTVFDRVQQQPIRRAQDVAFLREVVKTYGVQDYTIMYIGMPLVRFWNWRTGR